jgi:hypothetical protein
VEQEHALVPEGVGYGGAGLEIGALVGQLVVFAEGLARVARADAAVEVHLLGHHVLPQAVDGCDVRAVAGERGDVGHARVEVSGAHRMAHGLALFEHGKMVLVVGAVELPHVLAAAHVDEEFGEVEVALFAGGAVELAEPDLDLLVAGGGLDLLAGAEGLVDEVGALAGDVEQRALAGDREVCGCGLVEVADVVELVAGPHVAPALFACHAVDETQRSRGVEVAVGLLGRRDRCDQPVEVGGQRGIGVSGERVGRALDDFEHV